MAADPEVQADLERRANKLFKKFDGEAAALAMAAAQFQRMAEGARPEKIEVHGGVSALNGYPFVHFAFGGDYSIQQSPDEARDFARNVAEAATNAVYEASLFKFLKESLGLDAERAGVVLGQLRAFRADRWGADAS